MRHTVSLGLSALLIISTASAALGQADGQKAFDEWAKFVVGGTWTTTNADNQKLEHTYRWVVPGKLLQLDGRGGPVPFVDLIRVDATTKDCSWSSFSDDGRTASGKLTLAPSGVWMLDLKGTGPNGENRYLGRITRIDSDTVKEEIVTDVSDGKPQPTGINTWKRTGQATRKDFDEYCQAWEGRWVGKITWVADWPGLGKRGDTVTAHIDNRIVENGNALLGTFYAGGGSATVLTVYDEASKQIQERFVISNGYVSNGIVYKQDGKWRFRDAGGLPDGTKTTAVGTLTISADGNTHTLTSEGTLGDKPTDPQNDVYRRVSKK